MSNIRVKRYSNPEATGYQGYVEDQDKQWVLFISTEGHVLMYDQREEDGAVKPPER